MSALALFYAGSRITADQLNSLGPATASRSSTQSVTSSTALVNDDTLFVTLDADSQYRILLGLFYTGAARGTGDLKYTFSVPTGATGFQSPQRENLSGNETGGFYFNWTDTVTAATETGGALGGAGGMNVIAIGSVTTASGGIFQLRWAQNTSNGTATTMQVGSFLEAVQTA